MNEQFLNDKLVAHLLKLGSDPVPNIRFNVSKIIQQIYPKLTNTNKDKCVSVLKEMEKDERDFDVKFFA